MTDITKFAQEVRRHVDESVVDTLGELIQHANSFYFGFAENDVDVFDDSVNGISVKVTNVNGLTATFCKPNGLTLPEEMAKAVLSFVKE